MCANRANVQTDGVGGTTNPTQARGTPAAAANGVKTKLKPYLTFMHCIISHISSIYTYAKRNSIVFNRLVGSGGRDVHGLRVCVSWNTVRRYIVQVAFGILVFISLAFFLSAKAGCECGVGV